MATVIGQPFTLNDWLVEPSLNRISRGDEIVKIDPQNMKVLELLASRPGEVFSQTEIEQHAWPGVVVTPNSVYQSIAQLRRALGDDKAKPTYIETIPRKGYRLVATEVRDANTKSSSAQTRRRIALSRSQLTIIATSLCIALAAVVAKDSLISPPPSSVVEHAEAEIAPDGLSSETMNDAQPSEAQIDLMRSMARAALANGKPREAHEILVKALRLEKRLSGTGHRRIGLIFNDLSNVSLWLREHAAAEKYARDAVDIYESTPRLFPARIRAMGHLAYVLTHLGKYEEAEPLLLESIALSREVYGDASFVTADHLTTLSQLFLERHRIAEAEKAAREALEIATSLRTEDLLIAYATAGLVEVLVEKGQFEEALQHAQQALTQLSGRVSENHPYMASAHEILGRTLAKMGRPEEAEPALRTALATWQANDGWNVRLARTSSTLGNVLLEIGRVEEADKYLAYASSLMPRESIGAFEQQTIAEHSSHVRKLALAKTNRKLASTALKQ